MNFILKPSLEHMALVKIAFTLWSQGDLRRERVTQYNLLVDKWAKMEEIVVEKVSKLLLPTMLKEKLLFIIGPVGLRILSWMKYHIYWNNFLSELPAMLIWSPQGTIDNKRTAEILVKDENIDIKQRFEIACIYCLEDDIHDLWDKLCFRGNIVDNFLTSFWIDYLNGNNECYLKKSLIDKFKSSAENGNEIATRYFYHKLSPEDTENLRVEIAKRIAFSVNLKSAHLDYERYSDVLCFLLSTLNVEKQAEIFESYTYEVLNYLLVWPRHNLFLEIVKDKFDFLSKERYADLLHDIADRMSCKRSCLNGLFGKIWQQSPKLYKQFVTDGDGFKHLLLKLYRKEKEKSIQLLLNNLSISARFYWMGYLQILSLW